MFCQCLGINFYFQSFLRSDLSVCLEVRGLSVAPPFPFPDVYERLHHLPDVVLLLADLLQLGLAAAHGQVAANHLEWGKVPGQVAFIIHVIASALGSSADLAPLIRGIVLASFGV